MKQIDRYPLVMHAGAHPAIRSKHVHSAEEEAAAAEEGFGLARPPIPEPEAERAALTLEERVSAIEEQLTALSARRKK